MVLLGVAVLVLLAQRILIPMVSIPQMQTWSTIFVATCVQAMPFLVLGTVLSAIIAVFVPATFFERVLPKNPVLAVPVAGLGGMALPGCECASVPVAASLMRRGVAPAVALTFLLAAPAVNPIVLVSTAVAFPNRPEMVGARFLASLLVAVVMGWLWLRFGKGDLMKLARGGVKGNTKWEQFRSASLHDLLHAGGFLVVGAMVAATFNVFVPIDVVAEIAERPWLAVLVLALMAFLVAMCSEADAFVAASFRELHPIAMLTFMVVGPAIDIKLAAMQTGTFGRRFTARFAPTTFVVAIGSAALIGWILL